jgi:exoribonuclease II
MWAYDNLPAPLRREVARAAIAPNTQEIREKLYALAQRLRMSERDVAELMVAAMPEAEIEKIQQFAADYRQRYGVELPHVAAGATVLR